MTITNVIKDNWKEDKANLRKAISVMKKSMSDHKAERKSEWKLYKKKVNEDLLNIEESLKNLIVLHKK